MAAGGSGTRKLSFNFTGHRERLAMEEHKQIPQSALHYLEARSRPARKRLQDLWFAPKPFESRALCERLGVLLVKKYAPTGGDRS